VDPAGRTVLVANYGGGNASALRIEADGRLGATTALVTPEAKTATAGERPPAAHGHWAGFDAGGHFAFVAFLGLDQLRAYRFDPEKGTLQPNDPPWAAVPARSGPRHAALHPGGRFAYVINETGCTMTAFTLDAAKASFKEIGTVSTLPLARQQGWSTAEVAIHPSGKFLYGSNRGHDSIAVFAIDPRSGAITPVEHQPTRGKTPRSFGIDPTGAYLLAANQDSDTIVVFRIDPATGRLQATPETVAVPAPVCVTFLSGQ
jgi:6-phosphogluconolactonase